MKMRGLIVVRLLAIISDTCLGMRENGAYQGVKYNSFMQQDTVLARDTSHTSERRCLQWHEFVTKRDVYSFGVYVGDNVFFWAVFIAFFDVLYNASPRPAEPCKCAERQWRQHEFEHIERTGNCCGLMRQA